MHPGCWTATTRPGKGPGIPGLVVAALLWCCPSAAGTAIAAYLRSSRREVVTEIFYSFSVLDLCPRAAARCRSTSTQTAVTMTAPMTTDCQYAETSSRL